MPKYTLFVWKNGMEHAAGMFDSKEEAQAAAKEQGTRKHEVRKMADADVNNTKLKIAAGWIDSLASRLDAVENKPYDKKGGSSHGGTVKYAHPNKRNKGKELQFGSQAEAESHAKELNKNNDDPDVEYKASWGYDPEKRQRTFGVHAGIKGTASTRGSVLK